MTVKISAYDTRACRGFVLTKTVDGIKKALFNGDLVKLADSEVMLVQAGNGATDEIPAFAHPFFFSKSTKNAAGTKDGMISYDHQDDDTCIALDVRSYGIYDQAQHEFRIRNTVEYALAKNRAILNQIWYTSNPTILRDFSLIPMMVFSSWISEAVTRRFGLEPREQFELSILAAIFYNSQFSNDDKLDEREFQRLSSSISRALRVSIKDVTGVLDKVSVIDDVEMFCTMAGEHIGSTRLAALNVGLLFSILNSTWFGTNAKEMVNVALEHPPTWLAILMAAYSERSFKNAAITKIAERVATKDTGADYLRGVLNLLSRAHD